MSSKESLCFSELFRLKETKMCFFHYGLCTCQTPNHNKIISLRLTKNAVFRAITELTENLVKVRSTIMDTLLSEQFSTHFAVCCVATRSIFKPIDRITIKYRQELYEMLIFNQDCISQAL